MCGYILKRTATQLRLWLRLAVSLSENASTVHDLRIHSGQFAEITLN